MGEKLIKMRMEEIFAITEIEGLREIPGLSNVICMALWGNEGFAYELHVTRELQKEGYRIIESNLKTKGKKDVDLVAEKEGKIYAIDIKSTNWNKMLYDSHFDKAKETKLHKKKARGILETLTDINERKDNGEFDGVMFVGAYSPPKKIYGIKLKKGIVKRAQLKIIPYER